MKKSERMDFDERQINIAKLLNQVSPIYQKYFLSDKDKIFTEQFTDGYRALECFLGHYAYERQGAAAAYPKIALKCIDERYEGGDKWRIPTKIDAKKLWKNYKDIAKKEFKLIKKDKETGNVTAKVNELRNPMHENKGVIDKLASKNISNIAVHVRDLLIAGKTRQAYEFFIGGKKIIKIRGIGDKIASFYLRDIVYLAPNLNEKDISNSELHLLQPIDTWLVQALKILFPDDEKELEKDITNNPTLRKKYQNRIVELCRESDVLSISFNQGAWVLGSQIAGEFETFKRALTRNNSAKKIIEEHIKEKERYLQEVQNVLTAFERS